MSENLPALICHRLGRTEGRLRSDASASPEVADAELHQRLGQLAAEERRQLAELGAVELFAELGLHRSLQQLLLQIPPAPVGRKSPDGRTALHMAASAGHWAVCELLLDAGQCMTGIDRRGRVPLGLAAAKGHSELLVAAFARDDGWRRHLGRYRDHEGRTALHAACKAGAQGVVEALLDHMEAPGEMAIARDDAPGWPAGFYAASGGHIGCLQLLAGRPDTLVGLLGRAADGRSLLHAAAQGGCPKTFELAVGLGLDLTESANDGETPAHDCARAGHANLMRWLLSLAGSHFHGVADARGQTPLHCACEAGSIELARLLAEAGHPLDALDDWGRTPAEAASARGHHLVAESLEAEAADRLSGSRLLHAAAECPKGEAVTSLLADNGVRLWQRDRRGWTAAHVAAHAGSREALERLLEAEPKLLTALTPGRSTLLHVAVMGRQESTVELLLALGLRTDIVSENGQTALRMAALNGLTGAFNAIAAASGGLRAAASAEAEAARRVDTTGRSLLHVAAAGGSAAIVRSLLALRLPSTDPALADAEGRLPVHWAALRGHAECLELLLTLPNANVWLKQPQSLHHLAAMSGSVETTKVLERLGVPRIKRDNRGRSILHAAAAGGNVELVRQSLKSGLSPNSKDARGATPAHSAASAGRHAVLRLLLDWGPPSGAQTNRGKTLLHAAARAGCAESARLLVVHGLSWDDVDAAGRTPAHAAARAGQTELLAERLKAKAPPPSALLHAAAEGGQLDTVELLLNSGHCCPFERDSAGRTAAQCAAASGNPRVLRALLACDRDGVLVRATDGAGQTLLHAAAATTAGVKSDRVVRRLLRMEGAAGQPLTPDAAGLTPVDLAVRAGNYRTLAALLAEVDEDLADLTDPEGRGLLHAACLAGHAETTQLLVAKGLSPWQPDAHGISAIVYAAAAQRPNSLRALIGGPAGSRLLRATAPGDAASLAHVAANANRPDNLRLLAAEGLPVLTATDADGWTPLQLAVNAKAWDAVFALVAETATESATVGGGHSAAVDAVLDMRTPDGRSLLHLAADAGHSKLAMAILELGAAMSSSSCASRPHPLMVAEKLGLQPLHEALLAGQAKLASKLLRAMPPKQATATSMVGAWQTPGQSCLQLAVIGGCLDCVRLCLNSWVWQMHSVDENGTTPVHVAARYGRDAALELMLAAGASYVHEVDAAGRTPLHAAAAGGHPATWDLLRKRRPASELQSDTEGLLPLHHAVLGGHATLVEQILNPGDDGDNDRLRLLESRTLQGRDSLLHLAARSGSEPVTRLLVRLLGREGRAQFGRNSRGNLPSEEACASGNAELAQLLAKLEAESATDASSDEKPSASTTFAGFQNPKSGSGSDDA